MASLSRLAQRALTTLLAVVAIVAQVALIHRSGPEGIEPVLLPVLGMGVVDSVVAALMALALAYGTDGEHGTHALSVCLAAWSYVLAYSGVVALAQPAASGLARTIFEAHFPLVEMLGLAGALRFSATFPTPLLAGDLAAAESFRPGLRTLQRARMALLTPGAPWIAAGIAFLALLGVNALAGGLPQEAPLNPFAALVRFAAFTVVVLNFRTAWQRARGAARRSLLWMVAGLTLLFVCLGALIGGNVLLSVTAWHVPLANWRPVVLDVGLLSLLWGIAMAVYYGGAIDPGRVTGRTAVLGGAVTVGFFLAAGLEALSSDVLVSRVAVPSGLGTAVAFVLTALAYRRVRPTLEATVARIRSGEPSRHPPGRGS